MNRQMMFPQQMAPSTFDEIRRLVYEISGIALSDSKESLVKARIAKRMRGLGIFNYNEYLEHILDDTTGREIQLLLDAISTNTTGFYREPNHFIFMREVVKKWSEEGMRNLRVWSAASSSGEEPFTIAMELKELLGTSASIDAKILATDINKTVLKAAQKGQYTPERIEPIPKHLLQRYFTKSEYGNMVIYTVSHELKKMIIYRQFNLAHQPCPIRPDLDIIFCRNVMIYFDNDMRKRLTAEFERLLKPGGYLFVGLAESLAGLTTNLECIKPSIYRKGK